MPKIESYRKQAKQLLRWHKERNYSLGGHVRYLERYREIKDAEVLTMPFPLALAQEIVAIEAGYPDWTALKTAVDGLAMPEREEKPLKLMGVVPILFVRDVTKAVAFYVDMLSFQRDFLHGNPPFYGAVSRDGVCLHLRFVHETNFAEISAREGSLILASIEVSDVKALFAEFEARGVVFPQRLVKQAWGGLDFHVRDPDGNQISFVEYRS
jgi:uncharacterized glyoxalase superfamily protein PhnB